MTKRILLGLTLLFVLSCNKDNDDDFIGYENGNVWLSGGLWHCAEQIHLDNGDTLIVNLEDIISFKSGDKGHLETPPSVANQISFCVALMESTLLLINPSFSVIIF